VFGVNGTDSGVQTNYPPARIRNASGVRLAHTWSVRSQRHPKAACSHCPADGFDNLKQCSFVPRVDIHSRCVRHVVGLRVHHRLTSDEWGVQMQPLCSRLSSSWNLLKSCTIMV
jgi:hypothetical protein